MSMSHAAYDQGMVLKTSTFPIRLKKVEKLSDDMSNIRSGDDRIAPCHSANGCPTDRPEKAIYLHLNSEFGVTY